MSEIKPYEHKIPSGLPKCCHGISIFDWGKTPLFPSCGCGKYFHPNHPVVSVPSKEKILDVVMNSEFYRNIVQRKEANNFTKELKNLVNDLYTLLTERK